jgi:hypothetical protein
MEDKQNQDASLDNASLHIPALQQLQSKAKKKNLGYRIADCYITLVLSLLRSQSGLFMSLRAGIRSCNGDLCPVGVG